MWSWLCCRDKQQQEPARKSKKLLTAAPKKKISERTYEQIKNTTIESEYKDNSEEKVIEKLDVYKGQQLNGLPHGNGVMQYINGDYYKGEWINGEKEGKGEHYYFQLRTVYNGEWKHNMKNGIGHQTEANGSEYEGQFKDGLRHGKGTYFDKQLNIKYSQIYFQGNLKQRKVLNGNGSKIEDQFPTLKLDKQRFNSDDLAGFQQKNPEIKELDLDFLLKYYGLKKIINLQFVDTPICEWTIKQVHLFLEQINLSQYKNIFYENKIKGKDLSQLDQKLMKQDLNMKLGDRKILRNYIFYIKSLSKSKKKDSSKQQKQKKLKKRRQQLSVKKKKQSLLNTITKSIEQIIQQDDQWNQVCSQEQLKDSNQSKQNIQNYRKKQNDYQTQNWDKYISKQINHQQNYHSQNQMQFLINDKTSQQTQKGSSENHTDQIELSPNRRKKSQQSKDIQGLNSQGAGNKKDKSSEDSQSSDDKNEQHNQIIIKRKKTTILPAPSQEIRQLYQFLKQNHSLQFIIKQKDIQIIKPIGEGGYGKVSMGKYIQTPVAVKDYMKAGRSHKNRQQFMKQVHILSDLKHPNIVLYMGLCITVNRYQLVTQYMENGSLYDQLHIKKTKFTKQQQFQIIDDIVQGMVYLHNKNMYHQDLKSSNVLIAEDYKVKLCDFGLSGHKSKKKKQKKFRIGTYQWMAPQVIRDQSIDFYSDVYSFGVIIWQILTQEIPYLGMSQAQIIGDVGHDKNHQLPRPPSDSDAFIVSIMDKCLQRQPNLRPDFRTIQQLIKQERNNRPPVKDVWKNM